MNRWSRRELLTGAVSSVGLAGCGASLGQFPFDHPEGERGTLAVRLCGVTCLHIASQGVGVLTDPFWSFLPLGQVAFGRVRSDPEQIEPYLPPLDQTHAVVVGHGHYDHCLDLAYVADRLHPDAKVFGSQSLVHQYAASPLPRPQVGVDDHVATVSRRGRAYTVAGGRIRILPILSGHPPQYLFVHLYRRHLKRDARRPPTRAGHFQEGLTLAWMIDFMDGERVANRVYVQTSSTGWPAGWVPQSVLDEHPVDLAVLAMDCARIKARGDRSIIDFLAPKRVLFCHYEDFFRPKSRPPREGVKVNLQKLRSALVSTDETQYLFPARDETFVF